MGRIVGRQTRLSNAGTWPAARMGFLLVWAVVLAWGGLLACGGPSDALLPDSASPTAPGPSPSPLPTFTPLPTPVPSPTPSPTPVPLEVTVHWEPTQVQQGETAILWVEANRPADLAAIFDGVHLSLVPLSPRHAWGVMPVPMWNPVGQRPLLVTARAHDSAEEAQVVFRVPVGAAAFPEEVLALPPDRATLLDPEIIRAEWELIRPIFETVTPQRLWTAAFTWPLTGTITTEFGTRRRYQGSQTYEYHGGLDIAAPEGTPVYAPAAGRVVFSDEVQVRGNLVILDHGMGVHTAYFHLARRDVAVGAEVQPGDKIGEVGSTGLSTGPHLHWEVRVYTVAVNPRQWMAHPWSLPDQP